MMLFVVRCLLLCCLPTVSLLFVDCWLLHVVRWRLVVVILTDGVVVCCLRFVVVAFCWGCLDFICLSLGADCCFVACCLMFVVRCLLCVVGCRLLLARRSSFVAVCLLIVVC